MAQALRTAGQDYNRNHSENNNADAQHWRPIWREDGFDGNLYTIRMTNGVKHVVKRAKYSVKR